VQIKFLESFDGGVMAIKSAMEISAS